MGSLLDRTMLLAIFGSVLAVGCYGSYQVSPDESVGGGLKTTQNDRDAGRVGIAPGFDVKGYRVIAVAKFPVVDPGLKDDDDRRLRESTLFARVVNLSETEFQPGDDKALKLEGAITRMGEGSQAMRALFGLYGAGAAKIQAETRVADMQSGQIVLVTADRRQASMGAWGGDAKDHIREAFDDMARDLTKFLVRLSKGQAPTP